MDQYPDQQYLAAPFPSSPLSNPLFFSVHFPFSPPTFNNEALQDLLPPPDIIDPHHPSSKTAAAAPPTSSTGTSRKDRHKKIVTAHGPRDRRMRLPIDTAREFFSLQDMLGFDKASNTVKWLLTNSASAIKDITASHMAEHNSDYKGNPVELEETKPINSKTSKRRNTDAVAPEKLPALHHKLARQSRAKARERARKRTIEKRRRKALQPNDEESHSHDKCSPPTQQHNLIVDYNYFNHEVMSLLGYSTSISG